MKTYSVKEASDILGIKPRAVQHRCKRDNIRKKSNKYLITDEIIALWKEIKATQNANANAMLNAMPNANATNLNERTQIDLQVQSLQLEIESLQDELDGYDSKVISEYINELTKEDLEALENKDINADGVKGNLVFVAKDKIYAEYEEQEYEALEQMLIEWRTLQKDIEHQEQLFNVEKKSLGELLEHYKAQFEYQKQQSEKILNIHQTLIDTIEKQNALAIQRNIIEANEKNIVNPDSWKPKN